MDEVIARDLLPSTQEGSPRLGIHPGLENDRLTQGVVAVHELVVALVQARDHLIHEWEPEGAAADV